MSGKSGRSRRGREPRGKGRGGSSNKTGSDGFVKQCAGSNGGMYGLGLLTSVLSEAMTCILLFFLAFKSVPAILLFSNSGSDVNCVFSGKSL